MERIKLEELYKNRGYRATISAAYNTFIENYKQIFRHTWLCMALMALLIPVVFVVAFAQVGGDFNPLVVGGYFLVSCLLLVVEMFYYGRVAMLFNEKAYGWNIGRVVKLWLWTMLLFSVIMLVVGGFVALAAIGIIPADQSAAQSVSPMAAEAANDMAYFKIMLLTYLLIFVVILLLLPYTYVSMKYIAEPQTHMWKLFFKNFKVGMRHWGYIFLTLFVMYIILMAVSFIIALPLLILFVVFILFIIGTPYGDEAAMPGYFPWLLYIVGAVTVFASMFISIIMFYVLYYIYGSIEAREKERKSLGTVAEETSLTNQ
ncbi:MAG: hypothetical protein IJ562_04995 [Prevotella sp.]|nr:hypothetical protein [Prevotella sp.]